MKYLNSSPKEKSVFRSFRWHSKGTSNFLVFGFALFLFFNCFSFSISAQRITTFQKSFGGSSDEFGASIAVLPDHGYILGSSTKSFGADGTDILLIRTDSLGKQIWAKTYGGSNDEGIPPFIFPSNVDVILSPDSSIVVCTNTKSYGAGGNDVYLLKIDLNGKVKWSKTYGGASDDYGLGIINDPNGGYMITGETYSYGAGNGDALLIKTDTGGSVLWAKAYGNSSNEENAYRIVSSHDGNFFICGYSKSSTSSYDQMFFKVDKNGKLLLDKVFGTSSLDDALSMAILPDSSIYVSGLTYNVFNSANTTALLSKFDKTGKLLWSKMYDKSTHNSFGTLLFDNSKNVFNCNLIESDQSQLGMIRLDTSGKIIFIKKDGPFEISGNYTDGIGHDFLQLPSGGFVKSYAIYGIGSGGGWDHFLAKIDDNGTNINSCNISSITLSPFDYKSSIMDNSYSFTTTSINPTIGSGVIVNSVTASDTFYCPPFIANFGIQKISDHNIQFSDSSYFEPNSWKWDFGEPASSTNTSALRNPSHIYLYPGTYQVKLVASNSSSDKDSVTKIVKVILTGISPQEGELNVELFPNPTDNILHVKLNEPQSQLITITDLIGKTVLSLQTNSVSDEEIETALLAKGMYIINIQTPKGNIKSRFIKE